MDDTKRFLAALECPDDTARDGHSYWPAGIPAEQAVSSSDPLVFQFLSDGNIDRYLATLRQMESARTTGINATNATNGQMTDVPAFPIDYADLGANWTAATVPIILCEFLAYQTALVYRAPHQIRQHLLGLDHRGQRYVAGITQYAFFDTSHPSSSVRHGDTQAHVFAHRGTGYVIFRGSSSFADWASNFDSRLTTETYPGLDGKPQTLVGAPRPARHTGFAIAWGAIAPDIELWVRDQMDSGRIDKIVLSGHSLGGALAVLAAYHFAARQICPVHAVVTFGAPKVGGAEFKAAYEHPRLGLKDRTLRVEAGEDVVTVLTAHGDDAHVGHGWPFNKRPLRPYWQMLLLRPIIGAGERARSKLERTRAAQDGAGGTVASSQPARSNAPTAPERHRTWRQFLLQLLLKALWHVARFLARTLAAHSVENRYGLYLSTLAYQRIRRYHRDRSLLACRIRGNQDNPRILEEVALKQANLDLTRHLRVARGAHPKTFRHLAGRPIRFANPKSLSQYEQKYVHYIV